MKPGTKFACWYGLCGFLGFTLAMYLGVEVFKGMHEWWVMPVVGLSFGIPLMFGMIMAGFFE